MTTTDQADSPDGRSSRSATAAASTASRQPPSGSQAPAPAVEPSGKWPSVPHLIVNQARYQLRIFMRNPAAAFFTVVFPMVIFIGVLVFEPGGKNFLEEFEPSRYQQRATPAFIAFAVMGATLTALAMRVTVTRERGILRRVQGTPLPKWAYVAGHVGSSLVVAYALCFVMLIVGALFFSVDIEWRLIPAGILTIAVGAAAFAALGVAQTAWIPSETGAPPLTNATTLVMLTTAFMPVDDVPRVVGWFASLFPLRHLVEALVPTYLSQTAAPGIQWGHLGALAIWGVIGLVGVIVSFKWEPQADAGSSKSPRRTRGSGRGRA